MEEKVSRRQFLSMLGYGAFFFIGAMIGLQTFSSGRNSSSSASETSLLPRASAASDGSWALGPDTLSIAIHAALLHNGKVLYISGSGNNPKNALGPYKAGIYDPKTQNQTKIILDEDLFCGGHCQLKNGNILFAGGTMVYKVDSFENLFQGLRCAYVFNVASESFTKVVSMVHGRWYPTLVSLRDGNVFTNSGLDEFGCMNDLTEIYDYKSNLWTIKFDPKSDMTYCVGHCSTDPAAGSPCYGGLGSGVNPAIGMYPRMHLLPSGLVAVCGQGNTLRTWSPSTGEWRAYGPMLGGSRNYGTSFLLPLNNTSGEKGSVLIAGGSADAESPATNHCEIASWDGTRLNTRVTAPMNYSRRYLTPVILPNGKLLVVGGTTQGNDVANAVYSPEMFDPATEDWTTLPSATVPRMYHSVALLLPDGRVWTASTSYTAKRGEMRTEIFSPSYVFEHRPSINGTPEVGDYGEKIKIPTTDGANVASVSLVRLSTVTHHFNTDQRLIWLRITKRGNFSINVDAPRNTNIAPPGYYLLHLVDAKGIPSEGVFVKIS